MVIKDEKFLCIIFSTSLKSNIEIIVYLSLENMRNLAKVCVLGFAYAAANISQIKSKLVYVCYLFYFYRVPNIEYCFILFNNSNSV